MYNISGWTMMESNLTKQFRLGYMNFIQINDRQKLELGWRCQWDWDIELGVNDGLCGTDNFDPRTKKYK